MKSSSIQELIEDIRAGKMIVLVDNEDRENEGDLVIAAEHCTPQVINFMATYGRGLICTPITQERADKLGLSLMVADNTDKFGTAFTVSIDAKNNTTTGISAQDRAVTVEAIIDENSGADDFRKPGHIFPLAARKGGVLVRAGHSEGAVDLAKLAGLKPAGVICEILNEDGTMARRPDLDKFAKTHNLKVGTISDLIKYRQHKERLVKRVTVSTLPTEFGEFNMIAYKTDIGDINHVALVKGDVEGKENVLVRVHSECLAGDVFASIRCDCGFQLHKAMEIIQEEGTGVILYMKQDCTSGGLDNTMLSYHFHEKVMENVDENVELSFPEGLRDYGIGAQILVDLGLHKIRLLTNNPKKIIGLEGYGLEISGRIPIEVEPRIENIKFLKTKRDKLGHLILKDEKNEAND